MGKVKQLWMDQIDEVEQLYLLGRITRDECEDDLRALNVSEEAIQEGLDVIENVRDN